MAGGRSGRTSIGGALGITAPQEGHGPSGGAPKPSRGLQTELPKGDMRLQQTQIENSVVTKVRYDRHKMQHLIQTLMPREMQLSQPGRRWPSGTKHQG